MRPSSTAAPMGFFASVFSVKICASTDSLFIYENRMGDAAGIRQAVADGLHARYFYHVQC